MRGGIAQAACHGLGSRRRESHRYNFVVERSKSHVKKIDFRAHAEAHDEEKAQLEELGELNAQLTEETGRGASVAVVDGVEKGICTAPISYVYQPDAKRLILRISARV